MNFLFTKERVYLDYASATPVSSRVERAMKPFWSRLFFNPNGLYKRAVETHTKLDEFRSGIARFFDVASDEVIFTSGGTESDNLAIIGVITEYQQKYPDSIPHIIVSTIEHAAVLETVQFLEMSGQITVSYLPVDATGVVMLESLKDLLTPQTIFVSVMMVNNEIGSIQPISDLVKTVRHFKKHTLGNPHALYPLIHTDASQALLYEEVRISKIGVDMLSCNAGKIYGPKGCGILIKKKRVPILAMMHGGNQEFGLRPGTHPMSLIAGTYEAFMELEEIRQTEVGRLWELRDKFCAELQMRFSHVVINSSRGVCVPGIINISFPGIDSELLLIELDARGIEVSSKSACKYDDPDESYVLRAMKGRGQHEEEGTVRVSIGRYTTRKDLQRCVQALQEVVEKYGKFYSSLEKKNTM